MGDPWRASAARRAASAAPGPSRASRPEPPLLRAKSVSLSERPRSKYGRPGDRDRPRPADHKYFPRQHSLDARPRPAAGKALVKQLNRKVVEKIPFALSVQNLSIPMKYADEPKPRRSTSKPTGSARPVDSQATEQCIPRSQVGDSRRLCERAAGGDTENKLLAQIRRASRVADFERILESDAIGGERARGHVWRASAAPCAPSAAVRPRDGSAYSLVAVSRAYHYLYRQHEDCLQPLIDKYRREHDDTRRDSFLDNGWFENLRDLSEFYEDDRALKKEVETITDRIIAEEVQAAPSEAAGRHGYFDVNLADLFGLRLHGEGYSPCRDEPPPSPDAERAVDAEEAWPAPSMSGAADDRRESRAVHRLARELRSLELDGDATVPTITFSECSEGRARPDPPDPADVVVHLAVPAVRGDEARPPMM